MNQTALVPVTGGDFPAQVYEPEQEIRRHTRIALIAMAILVFGLGLAAALIPVGGAVVGGGQIGAESRIKRIAHPTGGVIAEIKVRDGQRVKRGQVLLRLDTTVSGVSADLAGQSVDQLMAQQARLMAERDGTGLTFPADLIKRNDASAREAMTAQRQLYEVRQREQAGIRAQLSERISQLRQQIAGYRSQINAFQRQQALLEPERKGVKELWDKELVTISRLNQLERTQVDMDGSIASLRASIAQTEAKISETQEQEIAMGQTRRSEAGTELAQVTAALNDQTIKSANAGDLYERSLIRAPYDGVVDKLAFSTIGDVIEPAQTIMEIVPAGDEMIVDASISPSDVDRVTVGQAARVKFTLFSMQSTPDLPGHVTFVSAERTNNKETGASFYRISIALDKDALRQEGITLRPGMPVEVFVSTGSRSMLSYLTKPLQDQFARAFNQ